MLDPRVALLAPGGKHMRVGTGRSREPDRRAGDRRPAPARRPDDRATRRKVFGERTLLVVMTGMGNDGLAGAEEVRRRGGRILVEAESTCTVYGMPRGRRGGESSPMRSLPLHETRRTPSLQEAAA